ncbi:3-isopropylmalate dehydratase large subunit [Paraburkholderia fungorum]|uniref:3-isopropylmalate dehydratase n=1 Tax=Paraburkholderia fungorum TaxID=134537 RepID=A0A420FK85_9BURK|nr:3-isopropylmalate dehydratase large subunit [Paraburkholderia fungorum]RKF33359.1 3-isopropylmalate dehydratase large subunit [Paraburkholderia fungorum]
MPLTLFDKLWNAHIVRELGEGWALLHIDRHLLHDLSGAPALNDLAERKLTMPSPELAFATADHMVSSAPGRTGETFPLGGMLWSALKQLTSKFGVRYFELGRPGQGIVHVMGPELGIVLPGMSVICGDSHTCTNGALGALAFGVGSSEILHALATQTLRQKKPKNFRVRFEGVMPKGVTAKDLILHLIGSLGANAGTGYAVEFGGSAIREMDIEGRLTICNLSVEMGAKYGLIAPDEKTFDYLRGRPFAPTGAALEEGITAWKILHGDEGAHFDREEVINVSETKPTITWGTSPEHVIPIDGIVPDPAEARPSDRATWAAAIEYMGLSPGVPIVGTSIDWVFIGSCANSRLSDLEEAARIADGRRVAAGVTAWVVPGSEEVKRMAEAKGLDQIFRRAGFEWREPGCSLCVAANGEKVPSGARVVSTSNRNFVGRQGPGARTHLTSPAMAAAAAVSGAIVDVRDLQQ